MSSASIATARPPTAASPRSMALPIIGVLLAVLLIVAGTIMASRRDEHLPTVYGRRRGGEASNSVNGTAVLIEMFKDAGSRVTTTSRFSPRLNRYDVIVWFPNDLKPPTVEQRQYLADWLKNGFGRTVVYVGRDYNAEIDYWKQIGPTVPPELARETLRRQAEARATWEAARSQMPAEEYAEWFTARRDEKPLEIDQLGGPWAEGVEATQADLHLEGRLDIPLEADRKSKTEDEELPENFEKLLTANGEPFVTRVVDDDWEDSEGQVIVIANGSFLLNYPLINHEHRKLAARLIEHCGAGQDVVFIESGIGGPAIVKKETSRGVPTALELLKIWPLNAILLHVAVLGIILCLARAPIFGRPRELPPEPLSDFGRHVQALGKLLARSKDRNYAQSRLAQYRQLAQRRSGRSHLRNK
jgi:hypothetical protein